MVITKQNSGVFNELAMRMKEERDSKVVHTIEKETCDIIDVDATEIMVIDVVKEQEVVGEQDDNVKPPIPSNFSDDAVRDIINSVQKSLNNSSPETEIMGRLSTLLVLYLADMITVKQLKSKCLNVDEKEFVNIITNEFTGVPAFADIETPTISDMNKDVAIFYLKELENVVNCIAGYIAENYSLSEGRILSDSIVKGITLQEILDNFTETMTRLVVELDRQEKQSKGVDPDPVVPIIFSNDKLSLDKKPVTKKQMEQLEKAFSGILSEVPNTVYQFNRLGELVELAISNGHMINTFIIDPDCFIGNGFNVLCNVPNDTILVNIKHEDILKKVFTNPSYLLTPEEIQLALDDLFMNGAIYHFIDMSKASFLPKLTKEEFQKLGKKLSFITNIDWTSLGLEACRLRFKSFKSIDEFQLVSDVSCKSPFDSCENIINGLSINVDNDKVSVIYGKVERVLKISNYNLM